MDEAEVQSDSEITGRIFKEDADGATKSNRARTVFQEKRHPDAAVKT
jgi:hypothetical protein